MDLAATAENFTMGDSYASSFFGNASTSSNSSFGLEQVPVFKFNDVTCAICLDNVKNRAFVNSCSHAFCLNCLLKWTKQKLECPLCMQSFSVVYYCVKSHTVYKRIPLRCLIEPSDARCSGEYGYYNSQFGRIKKMFDYGSLLTQDKEKLPINFRKSMRHDAYSFRQLIYDNNYWSLGERHPHDWLEPDFYTHSPEFIVHIFPWLYRELEVLLSEKDHLIDEAFDLVVSTLQIYEAYSGKCVNNLKPFLGEQTQHFLHELINFILSRKAMPVYDEVVKYSTVNFLRASAIRGAIVNGPGDHEFITLDEDDQPKISTGTKRQQHESFFPTVSYADIVAITPDRHKVDRYYAFRAETVENEPAVDEPESEPTPSYSNWDSSDFLMGYDSHCPTEMIIKAIFNTKRQRR